MGLKDRLRSAYWHIRLRLLGVRVGRRLQVLGPLHVLLRDSASGANIEIGDDVTLGGRCYLRLRKNGRIRIGNGVKMGTEVWLVGANDAELAIGDRTNVGSYCILNGGHGLRIGADGVLAAFVYINTSDHRFERGRPINQQGFVGAPIDIGADCWLGGHVFVGKGVTLGEGCVVGAGAVVVHDLPPFSVAAGNPAKVLRERR